VNDRVDRDELEFDAAESPALGASRQSEHLASFRSLLAGGRLSEALSLAIDCLALEPSGGSMRRAVLQAAQTPETNAELHRLLGGTLGREDNSSIRIGLYLITGVLSGIPLRAALATKLEWISGIRWLINDVPPETICRIIDSLRHFPHGRFLNNIRRLADATAAIPPGPSFKDLPEQGVRLLTNPGRDCETLLVCLSGKRGGLGMPLLYFERWVVQAGGHALYLRNSGDRMHFSAEADAEDEGMIRFVHQTAERLGVKRIATIGNSLGGFNALVAGVRLGAERSLCTSGRSRALARKSGIEGVETMLSGSGAAKVAAAYALAACTPEVLCLFSEGNGSDAWEAGQLAGLDKVHVCALPGSGHNTVHTLVETGHLDGVLRWLLGRATALPALPMPSPGSLQHTQDVGFE
jgi:hypothetical protein